MHDVQKVGKCKRKAGDQAVIDAQQSNLTSTAGLMRCIQQWQTDSKLWQ